MKYTPSQIIAQFRISTEGEYIPQNKIQKRLREFCMDHFPQEFRDQGTTIERLERSTRDSKTVVQKRLENIPDWISFN